MKQVNPTSLNCLVNGRLVQLSWSEFKALMFLMDHSPRWVSNSALGEFLYGQRRATIADPHNSVGQIVAHLRLKIGPELVHGKRGYGGGYRVL